MCRIVVDNAPVRAYDMWNTRPENRSMNITPSTLAIIAVACTAACGGSDRTVAAMMPTAPTVAASPPFPAVDRPARVFDVSGPVSDPLSAWTLGSRYLLYDDGAFVLQFLSGRTYTGRYQQRGGDVRFQWDAGSAAGPWGATGALTDELLTVRYNIIMQLSDFEDAVYRRSQ